MIYLNEVCSKLRELLNSESNPTPYFFDVQTVGYHWDTVISESERRNVIRVFVSSLGGNFNPVKGLDQANYSIPIVLYFPVRFKDDMLPLFDYIRSAFVGETVNIGTLSGNAISNLSIYQFGEIEERDFQSFNEWIEETFKLPLEVMEPYMSMSFSLYLSTLGSDFLWGNDASAELSYTTTALNVTQTIYGLRYEPFDEIVSGLVAWDVVFEAYVGNNGITYYLEPSNSLKPSGTVFIKDNGSFVSIGAGLGTTSKTENASLSFSGGSLQCVIQSSDQQVMGKDYETSGLPYSTTTSQSFVAYPKSNALWNVLTLASMQGAITSFAFSLKITIGPLSVTKPVNVASANWSIEKGQPMTVNLTFSKRYE